MKSPRRDSPPIGEKRKTHFSHGVGGEGEPHLDSSTLAKELLDQTQLLAQIRHGVEFDPFLLEKLGRIACLTANEVHQNTLHLKAIRSSMEALVEMYRTVNPAAALEQDRLAKLRVEIKRCCPPENSPS